MKNRIVIAISVVMVAIATLLTSLVAVSYFSKDADYENYISMAYLPQWTYQTSEDLERYDFSKTTHINYSFALVDSIILRPYLSDEAGARLDELNKVLLSYDEPPEVLVSIGGAGAGNFCAAARTVEGREAFASGCKELMDRYSLGGIDVDW